MPEQLDSQHEDRLTWRLMTLVKYLIATSVFSSLEVGSFIFVCIMKYADGPGGASNEALPMVALVILPLFLAVMTKTDLETEAWRFGTSYKGVYISLSWLTISAIVGICLHVVQWEGLLIKLTIPSIICAGSVPWIAIWAFTYYRLERRLQKNNNLVMRNRRS